MPIPVIARTQSAELLGAVLDGAQLQGALLRNTQRMWVHQPYAKAPARRAQPALVFRKSVAPVQPGHPPGVAFVEGSSSIGCGATPAPSAGPSKEGHGDSP